MRQQWQDGKQHHTNYKHKSSLLFASETVLAPVEAARLCRQACIGAAMSSCAFLPVNTRIDSCRHLFVNLDAA